MRNYSVDGHTFHYGVHVKVVHDPDKYPEQYGAWWVWIDGVSVAIARVSMARDGGTIRVDLAGDYGHILFPNSITNTDRVPKYNGVDIIDNKDPLSKIKELAERKWEAEIKYAKAKENLTAASADFFDYLKEL